MKGRNSLVNAKDTIHDEIILVVNIYLPKHSRNYKKCKIDRNALIKGKMTISLLVQSKSNGQKINTDVKGLDNVISRSQGSLSRHTL